MSKEYILRVQCPDKYGIVAKVSTTLNKANLFILDSAHSVSYTHLTLPTKVSG
mgnify:CR=1 FL=1